MSDPTDCIRLTSTRRLARQLAEDEREEQLARGLRAWRPTPTLQVEDWLRRRWQSTWPERRSLSERQEEALWEVVVEGAGSSRSETAAGEGRAGSPDLLLPAPDRAAQALAAHRLLVEWQCEVPSEPDLSTEARAFLRWRSQVFEELTKRGWLDRPGVLQWALESIQQVSGPGLPRRFEFHGFDELTPRLRSLRSFLRDRGAEVLDVGAQAAGTQLRLVSAADPTEEITRAAQWSRDRLAEHPKASIAIIVPGLDRVRETVERIFEDELTPGAILQADPDRCQYRHNLSLGPALDERPIVAAALAGLALVDEVALDDFLPLLRSPFVGRESSDNAAAEGEWAARVVLESDLRESRLFRAPLEAHAEAAQRAGAFGLSRMLSSVIEQDRPGPSLPSSWSVWFSERLRKMGWPGSRVLSSTEQQTAQRFRDLLEELAELDAITGPLEWEAAVVRITAWARRLRFQPRGRSARIQILGALEAGGLVFDHVWVMGMQDEGWPPRANPNPLLPIAWQREQGLPHSSPQRELEFWRGVTTRLLASGTEVVASYPRQIDGREQRRSSLLAEEAASFDQAVVGQEAGSSRDFARTLLAHGTEASEECPPESPLPLGRMTSTDPPLPVGVVTVRGGVQIFSDQARCPFRAFAYHRLQAKGLETPDDSIDPRERGQLLHRALELFWRSWKNHAELVERPLSEREAAIRTAVRQAADELLHSRHDLLPLFRRLECRRAFEIIRDWLGIEEGRPPFEVVELETLRQVTRGGLQVRGRVDRVDRLESGARVILDYKASKGWRVADWDGDRPETPQLPLYAVGEREQIQPGGGDFLAGVAFALLDREVLAFRGRTMRDNLLPIRGRDPNPDLAWSDRLDAWVETLDRIGVSFRCGHAEVDPLVPRQTCTTCDLHGLCRIHAQTKTQTRKTQGQEVPREEPEGESEGGGDT